MEQKIYTHHVETGKRFLDTRKPNIKILNRRWKLFKTNGDNVISSVQFGYHRCKLFEQLNIEQLLDARLDL